MNRFQKKLIVAAVSGVVASLAGQVKAVTYTYTAPATAVTPGNWTTGTNWSAVPVSGIDTQLIFGGALDASVATVSTNNIASPPFQLNNLTFNASGTTTAGTYTIAGSQLEFINDSGAITPTMTLSGGTTTPALTISNTFKLTNDLSITATTGGTLSGVISGASNLAISGGGTVSLGTGTSTFGGVGKTITVSDGSTVRTTNNSNFNALGSGSNKLVLNGGGYTASAGNDYGSTFSRAIELQTGGTNTIQNTASSSRELFFSSLLTGNGGFTNAGSNAELVFGNLSSTLGGTVTSAAAGIYARADATGDALGSANLEIAGSNFIFGSNSASPIVIADFTRNLAVNGNGGLNASDNHTLNMTGLLTGSSNLSINNVTENQSYGGLVVNGAGSNSVVNLSGDLSGFTGGLSVSRGTLVLSETGANGITSLAISNGARVDYLPTTVGSNLALGSSTLNFAAGSAVRLAWDATTSNKITAGGAATISGVFLDMTGNYTSGTTYDVLAAGSGLDTGIYNFLNTTDYTVAVNKTATLVSITPTSGATPLTDAYWKGGLAGANNVLTASDGSTASNWVATDGGADQPLTPSVGTNVIFSNSTVTTVPTATKLGADMSIKTLTISDTVNAIGIVDEGYKLTITPTSATTGITIDSGAKASSIATDVALGADQTWTNNSANTLSVSGRVRGAFALTKAGTGTLQFVRPDSASSQDNDFSGGLYVNAGTVSFDATGGTPNTYSGSYWGSGTIYLGDTSGSENTALSTDKNQKVTAPIVVRGGNSGIATLNLWNSNPTANAMVVSGGITLGSDNGSGYLAHDVTIGGSLSNVNAYVGSTSGGTGLGISGTGNVTVNFANSSAELKLNANNTYTGSMTLATSNLGVASLNGTNANVTGYDVQGGTLKIGNAANISSTSTVNVGALGKLDLNGKSPTIYSLSGSGLATTGATGTLTISPAAGSTDFSGTIQSTLGTLAVAKTGNGTQIFSGPNTYTGATSVTGGTLLVNGSLGVTATSVSTGGTLGGSGVIGGMVTVTDGTLAPGNVVGTFAINNTLGMGASSILAVDLNAADMTVGGGINDLIDGVTTLTLDGKLNVASAPLDSGTWRLINYSGSLNNNGLDINSISLMAGRTASIDTSTAGQVNLVIIPEPATVSLLGLAGFGLLAGRRRRA